MAFKPIPSIIAVLIALLIWFVIPVPEGVNPNAWHLLALFIGTIAGIIGKAMPLGALSVIAIALVAITQVTVPVDTKNPSSQAIKDALSSFSNTLIWLIAVAVMIARGVIKTRLGERIGYFFIALFGKKTLGIGYALAIAEVVLAPITPSNTARGGGIIHPIMQSIAGAFHSTPEENTENKIGRYLALVNYQANPITSGMFVTATAPNPLVVSYVNELAGTNFHLDWITWAIAMLVPGLICLFIMPLVIYGLSRPEITSTPDATGFARERLRALGPISRDEWWMIVVFVLLLLLWADIPVYLFGPVVKLNATTTAFLGLSILLLVGVLSWEDVKAEKGAWDTLIWFSALIMMASYLSKLGLIDWFALNIEHRIDALHAGWFASMGLLALVYLYAHYFFASTTAHVTAMFAAFYAAGLALGAPPALYALILAAVGNIMMTLTHYATGTAPIIYNSGYVSMGEWWRVGFIMSVINTIVWVGVGMIWWKVLGYY